jgi:superfamily I DNA/RNA helicase
MNLLKFNEKLEQLNPEQRQAVENTEGALMVIAGPGSGKTQILSMRVANILIQNDVNPSNILCLTFTNAATKNMQQRLSKIIGPTAYDVNICTFHGFGSALINQYQSKFFDRFGLDARQAEPVMQQQVFEEIMNNLPIGNPLGSKNPDGSWNFLRDIKSCISDLRKGGLTPVDYKQILETNKPILDEFQAVLDQYQNELGASLQKKENQVGYFIAINEMLEKWSEISNNLNNPKNCNSELDLESFVVGKKTSKLNLSNSYNLFGKDFITNFALIYQQTLESEKPKASELKKFLEKFITKDQDNKYIFKDLYNFEKQVSLCEIYKQYRQKMFDSRLYDFDDMILEVVQKIKTDNELKNNLLEKYQYILVDEFQDTSGVQLELIIELTDTIKTAGIEPNIMVVGDDDQSIYKFQGACTSNLIKFTELFPSCQFITLQKNYRSSHKIVESCKSIAGNITDRITNLIPQVNKNPMAHNKVDHSKIHHLQFDSCLEESLWVVQKCQELIVNGTKPSEIAILSRGHKDLAKIIEISSKVGLVTNYERGNNILYEVKIQQLIKTMEYIDSLNNPSLKFEKDDLLCEILQFDFFGFDQLQIRSLAILARQSKMSWIDSMLKAVEWKKNISNLINNAEVGNSPYLGGGKTESFDGGSMAVESLNYNSDTSDTVLAATNQFSPQAPNYPVASQQPLDRGNKNDSIQFKNVDSCSTDIISETLSNLSPEFSEELQQIALFFLDLAKASLNEPGELIIDKLIGVDTLQSSDDTRDEDDEAEFSDNNKIDISLTSEPLEEQGLFQTMENSLERQGLLNSKKIYLSKYKKVYFDKLLHKVDSQTDLKLLSNLRFLINSIRGFGNNKILSLSEIVQTLKLYQTDPELSMIDNSVFMTTVNSVNLMTAHKSKGLEFDVVFVVNCTQDNWCGKNIGCKISLLSHLGLAGETDNTDDKLRLFYVALTRAQNHIYITTAINSDTGESKNELSFLQHMDPNSLEKSIITDKKGECLEIDLQKTLSHIELQTQEYKILEGLLQDYKMPVTHLNNFLDMETKTGSTKRGPAKFLEANLLKFPQTPTPKSSYGTAIHKALQDFYNQNAKTKTKPNLEFLIENFEMSLNTQKMTKQDREKLREFGKHNLSKWFDLKKVLEENYKVEHSFSSGVKVGEAIITGNLDKILMDNQNRTIAVVDYKTGTIFQEWDRYKVPPKNKIMQVGDLKKSKEQGYYNQLVFYKLLIENSSEFKNKYQVNLGQIEFIDCSYQAANYNYKTLPTLNLHISQAEADRLEKIIQAAWHRIMNLDFSIPKDFEDSIVGTKEWMEYLYYEGLELSNKKSFL